MAYQKDYNFIFENGDTFTLHAKGKGQARLLLSLFSPDRIGETAIGYVEGDKENTKPCEQYIFRFITKNEN